MKEEDGIDTGNHSALPWFVETRNTSLIILAVFLFLGAVTLLLCYEHNEGATELRLKEDRTTAGLIALILEEHSQKIVSTMESYTQRPLLIGAVEEKDAEKAGVHLVSLTKNSPDIESVIITDPKGTAWASYPYRPELMGKNLAHRDWYRGVSARWKPYISDATLRLVAEKDVGIMVCVPFLDKSEKVIGILVNAQRTAGLAKIIRRVPLDAGSSVSVTDRLGNMVYSSRYPFDKQINRYPFYRTAGERQGDKNPSFLVEDPSRLEKGRYISYADVGGTGWTVFAGRDRSAILLSELGHYVQIGSISFLIFLMIAVSLLYFRKRIMVQQLTDRLETEKTLSESRERFRLATRATKDVIWDWNLVTDALWWGEGFEGLFGYRDKGQDLSIDSWHDHIHPADRERVFSGIRAKIDGGDDFWSDEYRFRRADGTDAYILDRGYVIHDDKDRPVRMVGAMIDITETKRAEEEIRSLNAELEKRVADRTAELLAANKELEAFSYSVSHDLRAPLRAIDGFSQALLEDYQGRLDEEGKGYLARVRQASQRMGRLIDDLLRLSRVSRAQIRHQAIDLSAMARSVAAELTSPDSNRPVNLSIAQGVTAHGDPELVRIVMENLFSNAYKFTRKNPTAAIGFGFTVRGDKQAYYVSDNGEGFDMQFAGKLFGAFQRLHSAAEYEGTGIGLATAQRIIQKHGGTIWAEARPGEGATFYFTL